MLSIVAINEQKYGLLSCDALYLSPVFVPLREETAGA